MGKAEKKTVLVFDDEIAKILLCDLERKLDNIGKVAPPCVYVCNSGKSYYGDLTPNEVEFFKSVNPENFSIWLERQDGETFECISKLSEPGLLETQFKSELLKRFKAYAAALQELGVKELELAADEKAIETHEKDETFDTKASLDSPGAKVKGKYHSENGGTSDFFQEIKKSLKATFDKAVIVDVEKIKPQLERDGFWTDEVVQAIVRARKQGRELEHVEMKISANVSSDLSSKFKMAAGLEAEAKTWQISGSAEVNASENIKALSSLAQNLSVKVSTGFSSVGSNANSTKPVSVDDVSNAEDFEIDHDEEKQNDNTSAAPQKGSLGDLRCPSCEASVSATAKFCSECGTPLARKCASCGTELKTGMKFCTECGTKV